jgi:DNA-binding Lrp family transcriptional regulator
METVGPNMAEIARRIGEPEESVSYAFRSNVLTNGYAVTAWPDREALGLRGIIAVVDIAQEYAHKMFELCDGMDYWYLHSFNRTVPDGKFILQFTMPEERYDDFPRLLKRMEKAGLITKVYRILRSSWRRHRPMRADLFDFKRGRWQFDWTQLSSEDVPELRSRTPRQEFDSVDLSILEQLEVNACYTTKEIAELTGISSRTAYRHAHRIEERHLVDAYGINWLRTHIDPNLGRPRAPKHRLGFIHTNVVDVNPRELARLSDKMNRLPFLWAELGGGDYVAETGVPLEQTVETMNYIGEALGPVAKRSNNFMIDPACSLSLATPIRLFDDSIGHWIFDLNSQMSYLEEQLRMIRKRTREGKEGQEAASA